MSGRPPAQGAHGPRQGMGRWMGRWMGRLLATLSLLAVTLAFLLPDHPADLLSAYWLRLPLELPLLLAAIMVLPNRAARPLAIALAGLAVAVTVLKVADLMTLSALQRRVNPYLDSHLIWNGWHFLSGAFGKVAAGLALLALALAFAGLLALLATGLTRLTRPLGHPNAAAPRRGAFILAGWVLVALAFHLAERAALPRAPADDGSLARIKAASLTRVLSKRVGETLRSVADLRVFAAGLSTAPGGAPAQHPLTLLTGKDVVLVFVESYGRSAVEDEAYAPRITARLTAAEAALRGSGHVMASTYARSPTAGGMSWLAHATFLSGLKVDSQARYDLLMRSDHASLNRLFREAGWETSAIMPAITMDWPEAAYFGYDRVLAAADLAYRGAPFNWITMPDQYTLDAFDRLVLAPARSAARPVMAEIALISSHAPWTPVPHLVNWEDVGDGTIFTPQTLGSETPRQVWSDPQKVRDHYVRTIDYSLETVFDFIRRDAGDTLYIVLGDHQPAAIITGLDASRDVPVHLISRDPQLIDHVIARGLTPGLLLGNSTGASSAASASRPMEDLRDLLLGDTRP